MAGREKPVMGKCILYFGMSMLVALFFTVYLYTFTVYPESPTIDTFGHFFKINYLHNSLKEGVLYPIYTEYWYNSMELFRYWPPLSYYAVALLQFVVGGDVLDAFFAFAGAAYLLNMTGWFLLGKSENRPGMAFLTGNLFFFCPDNVRVFYGEGNIPRIFIASLLPFVFYFVWEILHYKNYKKLIGLLVVISLITTAHYMIAAMTGISVFILCAVYSVMNKEWKEIVVITVDLGLAYLTAGIFLLPGLTGGGLTSQSSEASVSTISQWAQEAVKSLNPFFRMGEGVITSFYFGLAIFVVALLGMIAADKKMGAGFITTLLIFVSTTTTASSVVRLLPMSQVFWMQRFVPMAMCIFFLSLLLWKRLRKSAILIFSIVMSLDSIGEIALLMKPHEGTIREIVERDVGEYLLPEAKALTRNRLGLLDFSMWGSIPSWYLTADMDESNVEYSFGWAYQGAKTMEDIVSINEAAQCGFYVYAFDRFLELGDDVVLVDKRQFPKEDGEEICKAADLAGYTLKKENEHAWLFNREDVTGSFGMIKEYKNLAIGKNAREICYIYPQFGYGDSSVLEDYTFEELIQYDKIYLSGFSYDDKVAAEGLLTKVADQGVEIFIDMQQVPMDKLSGKAEFMGVYAQYVAFTEKFPVLSTDNGSEFKLDFRTAGYDNWNTVYLTGAEKNIKTAYYDSVTNLAYVAQNGNENITFLGFNPVYYYHQVQIPELLIFLNEVFEEEPGQVAEHELVPIEVSYEPRQVTIYSPRDNVRTGVAALDCYICVDGVEKRAWNNVLVVDSGITVFKVKYTDFKIGAFVSCFGILGSIGFWSFLFQLQKRRREDEVPDISAGRGVNAGDAR